MMNDINYTESNGEKQRIISISLTAKDMFKIVGIICLTVLIVVMIVCAYKAGMMEGLLLLIGALGIIGLFGFMMRD